MSAVKYRVKVEDIRDDGQAACRRGRDGVLLIVLPARGCFSAQTEFSPAAAIELGRALIELGEEAQRVD